jgi:hypothetical protein
MKQADPRNMFKKASKSVCISTIVVPRDLLSPTSSSSSGIKTPETTEEDPDDRQPADEGDIQMEDTSDYLCSPSVVAVTKNDL